MVMGNHTQRCPCALCYALAPTFREVKLPQSNKEYRARVRATLRRRVSDRNPTPPVLTHDITIMSRSCPWKLSIVLTSTFLEEQELQQRYV